MTNQNKFYSLTEVMIMLGMLSKKTTCVAYAAMDNDQKPVIRVVNPLMGNADYFHYLTPDELYALQQRGWFTEWATVDITKRKYAAKTKKIAYAQAVVVNRIPDPVGKTIAEIKDEVVSHFPDLAQKMAALTEEDIEVAVYNALYGAAKSKRLKKTRK